MTAAPELRRLLIANRGEIARRIARTCRAMGIETVAVYSDPDQEAPLLREVGAAVPLPGSSATDTYLRGELLIDAARRSGAQAIHPGYGFLAENAAFARAVVDAGLLFVGPTAEAIAVMGNKVAAKEQAARLGLPLLPSVALEGGAAAARGVGFPLLVKAAAGGGGRGMRVVRAAGELAAAIAAARREAESSFGDSAVYGERYLEAPRHLEVQVMGDTEGRVVHLYERECSLQRRFQKVVEEAPAPGLSEELRARLWAYAASLARAISYRSAGTVEFLLDGDQLYFLEMNTRLQVEHPVTELITGFDLVRLQLEVAAGAPLPAQDQIPAPHGCAIEARLCAEDPRDDFSPRTGELVRFELARSEGVRIDSGYESGSVVSPYYDSLLAKIIVHDADRARALWRLRSALRAARLHGPVTNRDLLLGVLAHPEVAAGAYTTDFLARHAPALLARDGAVGDLGPSAIAAALAVQAHHRTRAPVLRELPSGFRNLRSDNQRQRLRHAEGEIEVAYAFLRDRLLVEVDGSPREVVLRAASANEVDCEIEGVRRVFTIDLDDERVWVSSALGGASFERVARLPPPPEDSGAGSLTAPLPGRVVRVLVGPGEAIARAQPLVVIEAMKMEHTIRSPAAGTVSEVLVAAGDQVEAGAALVALVSAAT